MKTRFSILLFAAAMAVTTHSQAQSKKDTIKIDPDKKINKAAKTVGHATASVAAKGFAKVADKTYNGKVGPEGQTVYIDKNAKYYYVNKKGTRIYITSAELKDKPAK